MNSLVPNAAMIDFKPLCPPALPRARRRIVPKGKAKSSLMTISDLPASASSSFAIRQASASPLKFMKVCGFTSFDRRPSIIPIPVNERHSRRFTVTPASAANLSMSRKPTLCRVPSYSLPGLPSPTIKYIADCRLKTANLTLIDRMAPACRFGKPIGNWQSTIGNALLLLFLGRAFFVFLLALADYFRFAGFFAFQRRRHRHRLFLNHADGRDYDIGCFQDFDPCGERNV